MDPANLVSYSTVFYSKGNYLVSCFEVPPHDGSLILQDGEEELEAHHIQLLVPQVQPAVRRDIAQQVHRPGYDNTNEVKPDKEVSDPRAR